jgi:hypothetical protein
MAQVNVQTAKEVTFLAKETTFETLPGSMKPLIIEADSWEADQNKTPLDDLDASPLLLDTLDKVDGVFEGSAKWKAKLKPFATQIQGSAPATQPALFDAMECIMGGMHVGAGSNITAGNVDDITVGSTAGVAVGQVIGISGSSDCQIAVVTALPGAGVVEFWPDIGSAVTSGNMMNGYNGFVTETNSKTFSVQHAYPDSADAQQEFRGCMGKMTLSTNINELVMIDFEAMPSDGQDGALALSTAVQSNPLAAGGHAVKNAVVLVQSAATTTRVHYCVEEMSLQFDPGMEFFPCHRTPQGRGGVVRVAGRGKSTLAMTIRFDQAQDSAWEARTEYRVLYSVPKGSGTSKRHVGFYAPKAVLARKPTREKSGGRYIMKLAFDLQIDNTATADTIAGSPFVTFAL